jgi:hypothetical protein
VADEFDPNEFFKALRQSASVKAGAIMFGQAQIAYFDALKEGGMSEEEAFNMLAHTTEQIVRGIFGAVGPICDVVLRAAAMMEVFEQFKPKSDKQVPE